MFFYSKTNAPGSRATLVYWDYTISYFNIWFIQFELMNLTEQFVSLIRADLYLQRMVHIELGLSFELHHFLSS